MTLKSKKLQKQDIEGLGILASVWMGYDKPRCEIIGETLNYKEIAKSLSNSQIRQDKIEDVVNTLQNGSVGDFCGRHLSRYMDSNEHKATLQLSQSILTKDLKTALEEPNSTLVKIAAMDIAHNATEYGHRMFKTACFLEEIGQLPKELKFMFWGKMNPAFYQEKDRFDLCEKFLEEPMKKIPPHASQTAFDRWIQKTGEFGYIDWMKTSADIEFLLAEHQSKMLENGIKNLISTERIGRERPIHSRGRSLYRNQRGERS